MLLEVIGEVVVVQVRRVCGEWGDNIAGNQRNRGRARDFPADTEVSGGGSAHNVGLDVVRGASGECDGAGLLAGEFGPLLECSRLIVPSDGLLGKA